MIFNNNWIANKHKQNKNIKLVLKNNINANLLYIIVWKKNLTSKSNYCEFMNLFNYITLLFFKYQNDTDNHFLDEFCDLKKKKNLKK